MNRLYNWFLMKFGYIFEGRTPSNNGVMIATIITLLIGIVLEYFILVPINLRSLDFVYFFIFLLIIFFVLKTLLTVKFDQISKVVLGLIVLLVCYACIGQLISHPLFHASAYQQQLSINKNANFYEDNPVVNYQSIPVVDRSSAERLGDRKMGEIVDYVSQFEVDSDYDQINYKDKPYRVTTISYSNIFKWFSNHKKGLPAYISVDMVTQESEVVRLQEGMRYSHSDLFFRNITRHIRLNYPSKMFEYPSFEIDDNGHPYFVASVYNYEIGVFGGKDIIGAILVDAIDGSSIYYDIEEVPQWIDQVYPSSLIVSQLTNWGLYTNGYLNTWFSQKGVLTPTDGYNYIAINDDVYLYTGLTSVSSDASNVGFALINMRTKEAKYYAISGAEEYSAMDSAKGKVQHLGYNSTFPILINAGGEPTYFMSLKDSAGLVKCYAFVSVGDYHLVAVGDSVVEAEKAYYQLLSDNNYEIEDVVSKQVTGKIEKIQEAVVEGNTHYYIMLENDPVIYIAPVSLNDYLPLASIDDEVTISLLNDHEVKSTLINAIEFH